MFQLIKSNKIVKEKKRQKMIKLINMNKIGIKLPNIFLSFDIKMFEFFIALSK